MRVAVFAFPLALMASGARGEVALEIPARVSFFEAPLIRVTGLQPLMPIAIRTTIVLPRGTVTSLARFHADLAGVVDTRSSVANGDYEGIDPMGPLWSARNDGRFCCPPSGSMLATIQVEDGDGQKLASGTIRREFLPSSVTVTKIGPPEAPFVANLYEHSGQGKRPVVITLTGSNGGIDPAMAPWAASQGYNVLALGYYHGEDLPDHLIEIPLEYFRDALDWLARRFSVRNLGVIGISKGAEAALLVASHYPDRVSAVAAFMPSHVVWEGADSRFRFEGDIRYYSSGKASWSLNGKPLPFVRKSPPPPGMTKRADATLGAYAPALDGVIDPAAVIPVEKIRAPVFLVSAGDDLTWPSQRMAREIKNQLIKQRSPREVQLWEYPAAGHMFSPPGLPVNVLLGGSPTANAQARRDAWSRLRDFLRAHLGDPPKVP